MVLEQDDGKINAKLAYEAITTISCDNVEKWRHKNLWKWHIPLKIKCFSLLCLENKILTWENLTNRGFEGPNICILCKNDPKFVYHLFVKCLFIRIVWNEVLAGLHISRD